MLIRSYTNDIIFKYHKHKRFAKDEVELCQDWISGLITITIYNYDS